jgi:hypothetical protein
MIQGKGKNELAAQVKQCIAGANKHFPNGSQPLQVGGVTSTVAGVTGVMQAFVDNRDAVEVSKAATKAKIETERVQAPAQLAVIRAFETVVRGTFGNSADVLADFGLAPPKARTPMTAEEKAVAAAKRKATRTARHTMGKNQKKSVQGSVTAKLVVTPAAPSPGGEPVASPAPVGSAPAGVTTVAPAPVGNGPAGATVAPVTPHSQ